MLEPGHLRLAIRTVHVLHRIFEFRRPGRLGLVRGLWASPAQYHN